MRLGVGLGWLWPGYLDPDACWGEVEVIEAGVCSIVFLHLVNKLSKETESDQRSDILRAEVSEIGIFLVERRFHFQRQTSHDVLDLLLSEGYIVRVFEAEELLHDVQVRLPFLDLGGEDFSTFLY